MTSLRGLHRHVGGHRGSGLIFTDTATPIQQQHPGYLQANLPQSAYGGGIIHTGILSPSTDTAADQKLTIDELAANGVDGILGEDQQSYGGSVVPERETNMIERLKLKVDQSSVEHKMELNSLKNQFVEQQEELVGHFQEIIQQKDQETRSVI